MRILKLAFWGFRSIHEVYLMSLSWLPAAAAEVRIFCIVAADKTHHRALFCQKSIFLTKLLYPNFFEIHCFMTVWKVYGRDGRQLEAPNNLSMFYISNRKRFSGLLKNDKVGRFPLMAITDVVRQSVTLPSRLSITTLPDSLSLASGTSAIL